MEDVPRNDAGAMIRQINGNPSHHIGFGSLLVFSTKKHLNHNKIPPTSFRTSFVGRKYRRSRRVEPRKSLEVLGGKITEKLGGILSLSIVVVVV